MVPPRPVDFFRSLIPIYCRRLRNSTTSRLPTAYSLTIPLSLLESALPDKHRVLPVFNRKPSHSSPLDATLIQVLLSVDSKRLTGNLSPLDATLTKKRGGGCRISLASRNQAIPPVPLQATVFGATIRHGTKRAASRGKQISPRRCLRLVSGHCFWMTAKRTSGTARFGSRLQVVPGSSVLIRVSGFVLTNPEPNWTDLAGWLAFQRRVGKAGSVRLG
jgi:hypothetical protein